MIENKRARERVRLLVNYVNEWNATAIQQQAEYQMYTLFNLHQPVIGVMTAWLTNYVHKVRAIIIAHVRH